MEIKRKKKKCYDMIVFNFYVKKVVIYVVYWLSMMVCLELFNSCNVFDKYI